MSKDVRGTVILLVYGGYLLAGSLIWYFASDLVDGGWIAAALVVGSLFVIHGAEQLGWRAQANHDRKLRERASSAPGTDALPPGP